MTLSSADVVLTAFYTTFSSKSGFAPLPYVNAELHPPIGTVRLGPDLTVNAVSLDGSRELHMWTIIKAENKIDSTTYTVAASNNKDRIFDHWEDGSTDRIRSLTINANTTVTAYYRTG